jgi:hypothetical protein
MLLTPIDRNQGGQSEDLAGTLDTGFGDLAPQPPMPTLGGVGTDNHSLHGVTPELTIGDPKKGCQILKSGHRNVVKMYPDKG